MQLPDQSLFLEILVDILRLHPAGLSEYALLQRLREDPRVAFERDRLDDPQDLFRTHFLLFHHLYRLREELRAGQAGDLDVHALNIRLHLDAPRESGALTQPDPLASYYLDLGNLTGVTCAEVERLLGEFWVRYGRHDRRAEALAVLDLPAEADAAAILRQYRRLAMRHHPDRGGDRERLQAINAAMAILVPRKPAG
jgi:DnaJ-domain-containing protein 1